jgi:hypothetical protein
MVKLFMIVFLLSLGILPGNAQILKKNTSRKAEKELFGKSHGKKKEIKVKESKAVLKAKKKQESNKKKLKRDYDKSIEWSKKRTLEIQTPEVKARMKQDKKDTAKRDKAKKKNIRTKTRKAGKKYK